MTKLTASSYLTSATATALDYAGTSAHQFALACYESAGGEWTPEDGDFQAFVDYYRNELVACYDNETPTAANFWKGFRA